MARPRQRRRALPSVKRWYRPRPMTVKRPVSCRSALARKVYAVARSRAPGVSTRPAEPSSSMPVRSLGRRLQVASPIARVRPATRTRPASAIVPASVSRR